MEPVTIKAAKGTIMQCPLCELAARVPASADVSAWLETFRSHIKDRHPK